MLLIFLLKIFISRHFDDEKVQNNSIYLNLKAFVTFYVYLH